MDLISISNEITMSLKEITDLLEVRHNDAMKIVEKMIENKDFGTATKISYQYIKGNNAKGTIDTYQLNKRQSIAVAAKLNTSLLMRIIDRLQELENKSLKLAVEWQKAREEGKLARKVETDVIKMFVEYATNQGSKNAHFYYANITKGTYKALFIIEKGSNIKGVRDILSTFQLNQLNTAEIIVQKAIAEHMEIGTHYKDIYKIAVSRVEELAHLLGKQLPGQDNVLQLK